jgi:hypothetical protein
MMIMMTMTVYLVTQCFACLLSSVSNTATLIKLPDMLSITIRRRERCRSGRGAARASALDQNTLDRGDQEREEKAEEEPPGKSIVFIQQVI